MLCMGVAQQQLALRAAELSAKPSALTEAAMGP